MQYGRDANDIYYSGTGVKTEGRVSFTFSTVQWLGFGAIQNPFLILMVQHRSDLWTCSPIYMMCYPL